jgi:hypothetical protein
MKLKVIHKLLGAQHSKLKQAALHLQTSQQKLRLGLLLNNSRLMHIFSKMIAS